VSDLTRKLARRSFLQAVSAAAAFPAFVPSGVLAREGAPGASDRLTFGHIGVGGMGTYHLHDMLDRARKGFVNVAAVCDVDENRLAAAAKLAGPQAVPYRDYRFILGRDDIDAVVIATPDHWHGVQTVHAAECGKHVYVEKPACCTIEEGQAMIVAARKNKVSVQVGSQGRSQPEAYLAHRYLVNKLGKVSTVTCWHYQTPSAPAVPDREPPPELDWDLWLGPLRWRPFNPQYLHGVFRWLLESGGGQIRDRGAHVFSCAKYLLGADGQEPVSVETKGTVPDEGLWDSAVDMEVKYTFKNPDWVLTWSQPGNRIPGEPRGPGEDKIERDGYGAVYHGENDTMILWAGDGGTWVERKVREWQPPAGATDVYKSPGHKEDWFNGIKTGAKTIMNIEAAVEVANMCVLGNISFLLGRKISWDPARKEIVGDEQARRMMGRPQRHPYHL
jgi:predicted dehydrogenase